MRVLMNGAVIHDDSNGSNGVLEVSTSPGSTGTTIELLLTSVGNPTDKKKLRFLLQTTGGLEIQTVSDDWATAFTMFALAHQNNVCVNVDQFGVNVDSNTGTGRVAVRNEDGTVAWGGVEVYNYPTTLGSQTRIQSKPMSGDKRDDIIADSGGDATNPCLLRLGGSLHRISIDANGFLKG